jgi:hypothetical protein
MSVDVQAEPVAAHYVGQEPYRAISSAAISSAALGLISVLALLDWTMLVVPVFGAIAGWYAIAQIRRRPGELAGRRVALAGIALSLLFLIVGATRLSYVYATEVPEGYERLSYELLQPDPEVTGQILPPSAHELVGRKVFVKGYVYPPSNPQYVKSFLLVRDEGSCCFGGNPKITDRIQVTLRDRTDLGRASGVYKVAGVFRIEVQQKAVDADIGGVFYHLDEAVLR